MRLTQFTITVRDYDEAIAYYTRVLGFELAEDTPRGLDGSGQPKRWVRVRPPGSDPRDAGILLARAANERQAASVGNQTGGRVFIFLHTDDFERDYAAMRSRGVVFVREPQTHDYGTVAVFQDLYGNLFDLIGPTR
jgi:catechol 2,3-dioxygenase-like lactoylglutathione lyase family enzyme